MDANTDALIAVPLQRDDGPLWRQAASRLRLAITEGHLRVGDELPPEAELARRFEISLITIRHALRALEADGLIRKRAAKTAIVAAADTPARRDLNSVADIIAATQDARLEIFGYAPRHSAEAAEAFGLPPSTRFPRLHGRVLRPNGPVSEITIYFPPEIGRRLTRSDFDDVVVFRSVERRLGIRVYGARITVAAEAADKSLAHLLDYHPGGPILTSRMLYFSDATTAVELTIARHRADRYRLTYDVRG
jgi:GntR family transcriptional regulator